MQIVIDIPEEEYKRVMDGKWEGNDLASYIEDGTPLPEGHGDLIDRRELELDYDWSEYEADTGQLIVNGYEAYSSTQIESAPAIIKAESEE